MTVVDDPPRPDDEAEEPAAGAPDAEPDATADAAAELAGRLGGWVARTAARAREEVEDVWAEAQELRRHW